MYLRLSQYLGIAIANVALNLLVAVGRAREVAELATEVARLAGLRLRGIARRDFTALVGIKMSARSSAVTVLGNRLLVDVVHCNSQYTRLEMGLVVTH